MNEIFYNSIFKNKKLFYLPNQKKNPKNKKKAERRMRRKTKRGFFVFVKGLQ
jgi:hypothetical protein